jgi:hypothetical protein
MGTLVLAVPMTSLPRLGSHAVLRSAPGRIELVLGNGDKWPALETRGDGGLDSSLRWQEVDVGDSECAQFLWPSAPWTWDQDRVVVQVLRAGNGEVAVVRIARERVDVVSDEEPVVRLTSNPSVPGEDSLFPLPRTARLEEQLARTLGRGETLALIHRISPEMALLTLVRWSD